MNTVDYNNDNFEDILDDYSEPRNMNYLTYPMYHCPLCSYSMPVEDEYNSDEDDDPGYRQRRRRRRRRRRRYPRPYFFPIVLPYHPFYPFYWY